MTVEEKDEILKEHRKLEAQLQSLYKRHDELCQEDGEIEEKKRSAKRIDTDGTPYGQEAEMFAKWIDEQKALRRYAGTVYEAAKEKGRKLMARRAEIRRLLEKYNSGGKGCEMAKQYYIGGLSYRKIAMLYEMKWPTVRRWVLNAVAAITDEELKKMQDVSPV